MNNNTTKGDETVNSSVGPDSAWKADSSRALLGYGFPASPMLGEEPSYSPSLVVSLRPILLRNEIVNNDEYTDRGFCQGYWSFSDTESTETTPSTPDLMYGGAPDVAGVIEDVNGKLIASPYMPNLRIPENIIAPTEDNPTPFVLGGENGTAPSLPPGRGSGHATNPSDTSALLKGIVSSDIETVEGEEGPGNSPPLPTPITYPPPPDLS